mmetsp:Transcript_107614/g.273189  ORF Transcript_107614/g.273189 Transcript_107614/m.273189 type:complete len:95 (-) Transcript_107614:501-785(-)
MMSKSSRTLHQEELEGCKQGLVSAVVGSRSSSLSGIGIPSGFGHADAGALDSSEHNKTPHTSAWMAEANRAPLAHDLHAETSASGTPRLARSSR